MTLLPDILVLLTMLAADYTAAKQLKHYVEHFIIYNGRHCYTTIIG